MTGPARWGSVAAAAVVLGVAGLWLAWSPLDANDVLAGDEGYYGTLARNLLADRAQWLSPSLTPLGPPGDKPPLYPGLLALSIALAGATATALRWPSIALAVWIAWAAGILARRSSLPGAGPAWVAPAVAAMLMTLPWFGDASRTAMSDIPMTAAGVAAWVAVTGGGRPVRRALVAGVLLGLAFQFKWWLAGVFVLPVLVASWAGAGSPRAPLALLASAAAVGLLHLGAVAIVEPALLGHWLDVYGRRMLIERVGDTDSVYARSPTYYASLLAHALVLVLPLAGLGLDRLRRRWREPAALAVLAGCAACLALSAFAVKSAVYLYALLPAWLIAAGAGAAAVACGNARPGILTAAVAVAGCPPLVAAMGGEPAPVAVWAAAWLAMLAAVWVVRARPRWSVTVALALCALAVAGGLVRQSRRLPARFHDPGYRVVARALAPYLAGQPPERPSFVAPEAPAFAYHLFRTGLYWGTPRERWTAGRLAAAQADSSLRAFVIDPSGGAYGADTDSATVAWLERDTREITREIEQEAGRSIAVRVFVRRPQGARR